jgi:uncharacterized protein (TIGR03086 family)
MSAIADRYRRLSEAFAAKVAAVPADRWDSQTPCAEWTARDLVQHMVDAQELYLGFVGRKLGEVPPVADDPAAAWDAARAVIQADLDDPERAGEEFDGFLGRTRWDESANDFLNFDLVVHNWDLSRAAGLDEQLDPDDVAWVLKRCDELGDVMQSSGAVGQPLDVPADADLQTRMLARVGRQA